METLQETLEKKCCIIREYFKNMYYIKLQNLTEMNLFLDSTKLSELNKQRSSHKQIHNKGEDYSNNNTNNKKPKPF